MDNSSNVIDLSARRKVKNPPPELEADEVPWHVYMATVILLDTAKPNAYPLNDWEKRFVAAMSTWRKEPTAKQEACLIAIRDKVEAVSSALLISWEWTERRRRDQAQALDRADGG
jgi:hypothetical protein